MGDEKKEVLQKKAKEPSEAEIETTLRDLRRIERNEHTDGNLALATLAKCLTTMIGYELVEEEPPPVEAVEAGEYPPPSEPVASEPASGPSAR